MSSRENATRRAAHLARQCRHACETPLAPRNPRRSEGDRAEAAQEQPKKHEIAPATRENGRRSTAASRRGAESSQIRAPPRGATGKTAPKHRKNARLGMLPWRNRVSCRGDMAKVRDSARPRRGNEELAAGEALKTRFFRTAVRPRGEWLGKAVLGPTFLGMRGGGSPPWPPQAPKYFPADDPHSCNIGGTQCPPAQPWRRTLEIRCNIELTAPDHQIFGGAPSPKPCFLAFPKTHLFARFYQCLST